MAENQTACEVSPMYDPPHPGEVLKGLYLDNLGLSVTDAAASLGVARKTLSALVNARAGVSPEMALRLERAFSTPAGVWLRLQTQYDLWHAQQNVDLSRVQVVYTAA